MINILYCTDNKFFVQQLLSVISLAKYTKEPLNVINLTGEMREYNPKGRSTTPAQDALLTKILKQSNPQSVFRSVDVSGLMKEYLLKGPNIQNKYYKYSAYVSVRLLAHLVSEVPDKIIYLDADVFLNDDIKKLWDIDISNVEIAGRRDDFRITRYMQSGVMLLNMKKIRENGVFDRALELVATKKYICYIDMSAMNTACKKRKLISKKLIPYKWRKGCIAHHVCALREGKIPFTKKWWHRIKIDETDFMRKLQPQYIWIYDEFDKIKAQNPQCF
ncbi:MAG: hypothetical protein LBN07_01235 [Christensenellaceae bacterium]|nr:hypothetical protein [Christensenellaceae bacterium]